MSDKWDKHQFGTFHISEVDIWTWTPILPILALCGTIINVSTDGDP